MNESSIRRQVSAGGIVFRKEGDAVEVVLISVGKQGRWQLPKGMIGMYETEQDAALREVKEETGLSTDLLDKIDTIDYYYSSGSREKRVRFHKQVHFYLMQYLSGSVKDHDHEVNEARWVEIMKAKDMLTFDSEKMLIEKAQVMIDRRSKGEGQLR